MSSVNAHFWWVLVFSLGIFCCYNLTTFHCCSDFFFFFFFDDNFFWQYFAAIISQPFIVVMILIFDDNVLAIFCCYNLTTFHCRYDFNFSWQFFWQWSWSTPPLPLLGAAIYSQFFYKLVMFLCWHHVYWWSAFENTKKNTKYRLSWIRLFNTLTGWKCFKVVLSKIKIFS